MMFSQTNAAVETLRTLHQLHRDLSEQRGRLRRGPNMIQAHEANVTRCEGEVSLAKEGAKKAKMACDAKQGHLRDGEEKVKKLRVQLNTASSNREYQALKDQIAATEMTNSVLADEILEGMEKLDELEKGIKLVEENLAKGKAERDRVKKQVAEESPGIQAKIQELETAMKASEATLPDDFAPIYHRVVASMHEDALAPVRGEYCDGCNQKVPLNAINKVLLAEPKPLICRGCGRLLYVPADWKQQ